MVHNKRGRAAEVVVAYLDQINLVKRLITPWLLDVEDADDVLVVKVAQQLHLSESSQTKHGVVERSDFLNGDLLPGWFVYRRAGLPLVSSECFVVGTTMDSQAYHLPDHTVGTLANNILNVILLAHVERDLTGARRVGGLGSRHDGPFVSRTLACLLVGS